MSTPHRLAALPPEPRAPDAPADVPRILALFRPYRGGIAVIGALILAAAVAGVISPFVIREIVDVALPQGDLRLLAWLVAALIGVSAVTNVLGVFQSVASTRIGQGVMHDLRTAVYTHLQRMSLDFFTGTRTGEVQSRIADDIGSMQAVVTSVMTQVVSQSATIVMSIVAMFALDWRLALFSLVTMPFAVWLNRRVGVRRRRIVTARQRKMADMTSGVQESLSVSGILLGRTMGRSDALTGAFTDDSADLADLEISSEVAGRWHLALVSFSLAIIPALTYLLGGTVMAQDATGDIAGDGTAATGMTIGTLVAFVALQNQLFMPMAGLLRVAVRVSSSLALFTRVFEYLDLPVRLGEREQPVELPAAAVRGEIRYEGVSFRYPGADADALSGVDLTAAPGTSTALVGATGSGKTTTGYLLARLYDPTSGTVRLDGHDLRNLSFASLSAAIGVVTQEAYLLHASIRVNLRFAAPDATDTEIEDACRIAQIHDHIASLPDGYDTLVGERGYRFSGGEKQRLALARTVLRNSPVLLLDEATSALDTATERAMSTALSTLGAGRTTVTIAHRLSTVRGADQILVLDHGRIVERGTYDALITAGGAFAALVAADAWADRTSGTGTEGPTTVGDARGGADPGDAPPDPAAS